jgi:hypothetical protein
LRTDQSKILLVATTAEMHQNGAEVIEHPGIGRSPPLMVTERINAVTDWLSV